MSAAVFGWVVELLRAGQTVRFVATGDSMWPAIPSGASVTAAPFCGQHARPGDVALYEVEGHVRVHRVVRALAEGVLELRGDSLPVSDAPVPAHAIVGRVVAVTPPGRLPLARQMLRRWLTGR